MIDLKEYGFRETEPYAGDLITGRVIETQRGNYTVITERGEVIATLKGTFYREAEVRGDFPCVGDFVRLQYNENGESRIAELRPRRSKFSRADFSGHASGYTKTILEQLVATNFEYVFIVSSLNIDFNVGRISRYLTQVYQSGGQPVVLLTKADLIEDYDTPVQEILRVAPDVPVHVISSHTGYGMEAIQEYLKPGVTIVFLGMSGVGKSSLLNTLMKQEVMAVKAIREKDSRGRHTTTHRQLFMLPCGAMVIDTPGMRELGLFDTAGAVSAGFSDVEELFAQCKFSDCRHETEPGCAVLAALKEGEISQERWKSYLSQKEETKFVEDKTGYLAEKRGKQKSIAMLNKRKNKKGK